MVASAWLDKDLKYRLRFVSKTVFGFLALMALVVRTVEWSQPGDNRVLNCRNVCINDTLNEKGEKTFTSIDASDCDSQELSLDKKLAGHSNPIFLKPSQNKKGRKFFYLHHF